MKTTRLALISLQNTFIDFGVRYVASAVKKAGYQVEVLWICQDPEKPLLSSSVDAIVQWIRSRDFDLVGIGVMSIHYSRAVSLTIEIQKRTKTPVIWGGIHPILALEKCLQTADYVCTGDGEDAVPLLLKALSEGVKEPEISNISFITFCFDKYL